MKSKITALFSLVFLLMLPLCRGQTTGGQWLPADDTFDSATELQKYKNMKGVPFYVDRHTGRVLVDIGNNVTFTGTVNTGTNSWITGFAPGLLLPAFSAPIVVSNTSTAPLYSTNLQSEAVLTFTNIILTTTNPVVLGAASWKIWSITAFGGLAGRTNNTNTVWIQGVITPQTNGLPVPAGQLRTWTMPDNKYTTADKIFLQGGTNESFTIYTTY